MTDWADIARQAAETAPARGQDWGFTFVHEHPVFYDCQPLPEARRAGLHDAIAALFAGRGIRELARAEHGGVVSIVFDGTHDDVDALRGEITEVLYAVSCATGDA